MKGRIVVRLLPLTCAALTLALVQPLEAQFGGLGRRIGDAAKKAAGVESEETAKPTVPGAPKPVVLRTDDPLVIPITTAVLDTFARAMQAEIELREEFRKELEARQATDSKYEPCKQQVAGSPEVIEIMMQLGNLPDNAPPEAMQDLMAKMAKDQEALVLKRCGPAPVPVNGAARLQEIKRRAVAAAGPIQ
jgi:hypothetical protein